MENDTMRESLERRQRRSDDPIIALHHQLSAVRRDAGFSAVVLVDDTGCLVAGAGAWPVCEELAAYAPLLSRRSTSRTADVDAEVEAMTPDTRVRAMWMDGSEVLLCSRGGSAPSAQTLLARAMAGCRRILASHV